MRVYELSKELKISNKELLDYLAQYFAPVQSHMAALAPDLVEAVKKHYFAQLNKKAENKIIESPVLSDKTIKKEVADIKPVSEKNQKQSRETAPVHNESFAPRKPVITENKNKQAISHVAKAPLSHSAHEQGSAVSKPVELIAKPMLLGELADFLHKPSSEIIMFLLRQGVVATKNQVLSVETVKKIADQYGVKLADQQARVTHSSQLSRMITEDADVRLPVVVVIGHVDHGKTTLLDTIRKTRVAAKEKGGITQHLGAYQVQTPNGALVFLDTPGHAAFSKMRGRGVKVADIAILVVAADDGVMPQTVEAIKHAQDAGITVIVALNKIDKVSPAQIETTKKTLAARGLVPEEWGGDIIMIPVSAKNGTGIDQLLDMVLLQSQMMDLKASSSCPGKGFILEAKFEKGRGPVATLLLHEGALSVGDCIVAGTTIGRVTALIDSDGNSLKKVLPSIPVQVAGFDTLPPIGEVCSVVSVSEYKQHQRGKQQSFSSLNKLASALTSADSAEAIRIILKADSEATLEALTEALEKLAVGKKRKLVLVHTAVGNITENEIDLAYTAQATIYGLHIAVDPKVAIYAQKQNVAIERFGIIYKLLEALEALLVEPKKPKLVATKIGEIVVRKVFEIKNLGVIAGSYVREGRIAREGTVQIYRGKSKIGEGKIVSLERDRKPLKEVHAGFECAFIVEGFSEWRVDDRAECFILMPE